MTDTEETGVDQSVVQDNGEIWAADKRELRQKLSRYYGIDGIRFANEHYVEGADEYAYDALIYWDGHKGHLIQSEIQPLGHPPSGAIGVDSAALPSVGAVKEVVDFHE